MANLVITVIAIALVAIASLMGAYYGGAAFLNNTNKAQAFAVMNQGVQIAGAWQDYMVNNLSAPPTDLSSLTPTYLSSIPQYPASKNGPTASAPWAVISGVVSGSTHYYGIADMGLSGANAASGTTTDPNAAACLWVIKAGSDSSPVNPSSGAFFTAIAPGGTGIGNATYGCALATSDVAFGTPLTNSGALPTTGGAAVGHYYTYYLLS
jgi:hypothetical protein